ncbi:hypothetical protein BASA81_009634 [Batrachochytrium salamandrivorans]|nr:hypothetical protein BASA81_009634 [Batrachochytrium salamandrivorans]
MAINDKCDLPNTDTFFYATGLPEPAALPQKTYNNNSNNNHNSIGGHAHILQNAPANLYADESLVMRHRHTTDARLDTSSSGSGSWLPEPLLGKLYRPLPDISGHLLPPQTVPKSREDDLCARPIDNASGSIGGGLNANPFKSIVMTHHLISTCDRGPIRPRPRPRSTRNSGLMLIQQP